MQSILQDLRYGARMLWKRPGFTVIAVITLALGIGANTAIFSVVNGVLLRPLPYKDPGRLTRVYSEFPTMNLRKFWISSPEFLDIQKEAKSWESIGAWSTGGVNLSSTGDPIRVASTRVTRSLINTLGVPPMSATDRPDLLYGLRCRRMIIPEINELVRAYAHAARRAREAGADGIEIVACNGYLLHQFLSSAINDRTDEYNGDLRTRARIVLEVMNAVRAAVGRDFFVSMKLSGRDEHNAYTAPLNRRIGNTIEDTMQVSQWLAEAGLDAIHVSQGDSFPHPLVPAGRLPADESRPAMAALFFEGTRVPNRLFLMQFALFRRITEWNWGRRMPFTRGADLLPEKIEGMNQDDAAKIKAASGLPVFCVGGWQTASRMREALNAGRCDVITIARSRRPAASIAASRGDIPWCTRSIANSQIRIAFFAARPTRVTRPTWK